MPRRRRVSPDKEIITFSTGSVVSGGGESVIIFPSTGELTIPVVMSHFTLEGIIYNGATATAPAHPVWVVYQQPELVAFDGTAPTASLTKFKGWFPYVILWGTGMCISDDTKVFGNIDQFRDGSRRRVQFGIKDHLRFYFINPVLGGTVSAAGTCSMRATIQFFVHF
jgi:hypothetical protein